MLGTTTDAVRSRMRGGKLRREEGEDGTVYVLIEGDQTPDGRGSGETGYDGRETGNSTGGDARQAVADSPLLERMASEIDYLRSQLDQEREANRENRRLLAAALERIPELEAARDIPPDEPGAPMTAQKDEGNGDRPRPSRALRAPLVAVQILLRAVMRIETEQSKGFWRRLFST